MERIVSGTMLTLLFIGMLTLAFNIQPVKAIISVNIRILSDPQSGQLVTLIDWGTLMPGQTASRTFYLISESNVNVSLSLSTRNWSPASAEGYFALNWNISGKVIKPGEGVNTRFTLSVSDNALNLNHFSFNTVITATGNFPPLETNDLPSTGLLTHAPVGGFSFEIEGYTATNPLAPYLVLITISAIGFTTIRRKTTRKTR